MLASAETATPANSASWPRASCSLRKIPSTESGVAPGSTMPNSSPPSRATVSPGRTAAVRRSATMRRNSSPLRWPSVSFTSLNRSRSTTTSATSVPSRPAEASAADTRSACRERLGKPVKVSCNAMNSDRRLCRRMRPATEASITPRSSHSTAKPTTIDTLNRFRDNDRWAAICSYGTAISTTPTTSSG